MNDKINGKTPTEIKIALNCTRTDVFCNDCPYGDHACGENLDIDALAYIEQLERERDAAQNDLYLAGSEQGTFCDICKHKGDACDKQKATEMYCWEWRGVREVE